MTLLQITMLVSATLDSASELGCAQDVSKALCESLKAATLGNFSQSMKIWHKAAVLVGEFADARPCTRCDGSGLIMHPKTTEFCGCN